MSSQITFYGGVHEIGGNKFLVEDKDTRIFLDFGMQMGKVNQYFAEFLNPRKLNGMGDLFEFGLLPRLKGLYRKDYAKHTGFGGEEETEFDAVLLTHAHVDHAAYIHYLRPEIPIYCTEATKLILQCLQDTGSSEEYITFKNSFQIYENSKGQMSRATSKKEGVVEPRNIKLFENLKKFSIDSIEIEPLSVDHSLPGVSGFILHTSKGSIAYTADIRFHGRRTSESQGFVGRCGNSNIDYLLCEGTRVSAGPSITEFEVEEKISEVIDDTKDLVVCNYPTRDLDRLLSFYNATKESDRDLVIDLKQAYLLKLFQTSDQWKNVYPKPDDKRIKIHIPRKTWGIIDKDITQWTEKILLEDYDDWEAEFIDYGNAVDYRDITSHQNKFVFYASDFQLTQLVDIRPAGNSRYIRSSTEPYNEEMAFEHLRIKRWLVHFGLLPNAQAEWEHIHVSGHGWGEQIKKLIEESNAKTLIPIHTEHEEYHKKWHKNVKMVETNSTMKL
jgi:ribonuclease J